MADNYDDIFGVTSGGGYDDIFGIEPERTPLNVATDTGVSLAKGIVGLGEAAAGVANIATGGLAGKGLDAVGYDPKQTQSFFSDLYSPAQKAANKRVDEAKGFIDTGKAMLQNPSTIFQGIVETAPAMLGGGATARGAIKGAQTFLPKLAAKTWAPVAAGAAGEGLVATGQQAEQIRQEQPDKELSLGQGALAVASGIGTGAFGFAGGSLAKKLGFTDFDTLLATGAKGIAKTEGWKGVVRKIVGGGISEGAFEEAPQTIQETILFNAAMDRPLMEGVPESTAQALILGTAMGAGANMLPSRQQQPEASPGPQTDMPPGSTQPVAVPPPDPIVQDIERAFAPTVAQTAEAAIKERNAPLDTTVSIARPADARILAQYGPDVVRVLSQANKAGNPISIDQALKLAPDMAAKVKSQEDQDSELIATGDLLNDIADSSQDAQLGEDVKFRRNKFEQMKAGQPGLETLPESQSTLTTNDANLNTKQPTQEAQDANRLGEVSEGGSGAAQANGENVPRPDGERVSDLEQPISQEGEMQRSNDGVYRETGRTSRKMPNFPTDTGSLDNRNGIPAQTNKDGGILSAEELDTLQLIRNPKYTTQPTEEQRPAFQQLVKQGYASTDDGLTYSITDKGRERLSQIGGQNGQGLDDTGTDRGTLPANAGNTATAGNAASGSSTMAAGREPGRVSGGAPQLQGDAQQPVREPQLRGVANANTQAPQETRMEAGPVQQGAVAQPATSAGQEQRNPPAELERDDRAEIAGVVEQPTKGIPITEIKATHGRAIGNVIAKARSEGNQDMTIAEARRIAEGGASANIQPRALLENREVSAQDGEGKEKILPSQTKDARKTGGDVAGGETAALGVNDSFSFERYDRETDSVKNETFSKGETVRVWFNKDKSSVGVIVGISKSNREARIKFPGAVRDRANSFEFGRIYKTEQPVAPDDKKGKGKLSKTIERVNSKNEPEGGFTDADSVVKKNLTTATVEESLTVQPITNEVQNAEVRKGQGQAEEDSNVSEKPTKKPGQIHDYSNTQVNIKGATADKIIAFGKRIPDSEIYVDPKDDSYGRETEPHITVRYGLDTDDPAKLTELSSLGSISAKVGKVSIFETEKYDVVKAEIEGDSLRAANKKVGELVDLPGETFKDYQPHATIAYVKKGEGKKYVGDKSLEGAEITFDEINLTDRTGKTHPIKLQSSQTVSASGAGETRNTPPAAEQNAESAQSLKAAKQPWQMATAKEYARSVFKGMGLRGKITEDELANFSKEHVRLIKNAINDGLDVPMEVLQNYRFNDFAKDEIERRKSASPPATDKFSLSVAPTPEIAKLQKELDGLLAKRDKMREKQMASYRNGTATRARTTTANANVSNLNDEITEIRRMIKEKSSVASRPRDTKTVKASVVTLPPSQQSSLSELTTKQRAILSKLRRAGKVELISNDEALELIRNEPRTEQKYSADGRRIEGFVLPSQPNKVYLITENIAKGELWAKIRHETGVHVRRALQSTKSFKSLTDSLEARKDEQSVTGQAIREAMAKVPEDTNPEYRNEEVLAYLVANNKNIGIVRQFLAMVKNALVKLGISPRIFTADDLTALTEIAVRREARGDVAGGANQDIKASYSTPGSLPTTPKFKAWFGASKVKSIVYHGSPTFAQFGNFTFDPNRATGKTNSPGRGLGIFFAEDETEARGYAGISGKVAVPQNRKPA